LEFVMFAFWEILVPRAVHTARRLKAGRPGVGHALVLSI
jgi:hypothetical protein